MTHTTPEVEEIVYEIDGIALSKPTSINGVLVQMWDRNVLTAYIESKLTTLTTKHQEEIEKAVEAEREKCQISNFKCSNHGVITPRPICPKCFPDTTSSSSYVE